MQLIYMYDDFYKGNGSGNHPDRKPKGRRLEPSYEPDLTQKDIDELFDRRPKGKPVQNESKFKVTIPEKESVFTPSVSSRTPKGRPLGQASSDSRDLYSSYDAMNISSHSPSDRTPKGRALNSIGNETSLPKASASPHKTGTPYKSSSAAAKPSYNTSRSTQSSYSNPADRSKAQRPAPQRTTRKKAAPKSKKTGASNGKKIAIAVAAVFVIIFASLFVYGYSILGKINFDSEFRDKNQYISSSELKSSSKVENVLFIGSDARSEVSGMRSDTMILFSIDKQNKKIKLTSFLRDSYVTIPSTGNKRKLNAACSSGGAQLVCDTLEYNFKTKIDSYVLVDFEAFTKFIDLLGGLDVPDVTAAEAKYLHDVVKVPVVNEGMNHFTGGATLWYCRIRYLDDDFHRTQRQRKVISAIIDKVTHTSPVKLMSVIDEVMPMITSSLSRNDLLSLGLGSLTKFLHYDIEQHQVPAKGTWTNANVYGSGAVLKMDIEENTRLLHSFLYDKDSKKEKETAEE